MTFQAWKKKFLKSITFQVFLDPYESCIVFAWIWENNLMVVVGNCLFSWLKTVILWNIVLQEITLLITVNSLYSGHCRDSTSLNYVYLGYRLCPYHRGVRLLGDVRRARVEIFWDTFTQWIMKWENWCLGSFHTDFYRTYNFVVQWKGASFKITADVCGWQKIETIFALFYPTTMKLLSKGVRKFRSNIVVF